MVKKLESAWEGSQFMLPEHMQAIDRQKHELGRRIKPELDAQEWVLIDQVLAYSKRYREQITITQFDSVQDIKIRGVVLAIDRQLRRIKFQMEYDYDWIKIDDVIQVTT